MAENQYFEVERTTLRQRMSARVWRSCYRMKRSLARLHQRIDYRLTKKMRKVVIYRTEVATF